MAMYKNVNGVKIKMSDSEVRSLELEQASIVAATPNPLHRDLTRSEFKGLLAASGYDAVWDGLEAALKGVTTPEAKAGRRALALHRAQDTFHLDATLALVGGFGPQIDVLFPDVKISAEDIISEWEETTGGSK